MLLRIVSYPLRRVGPAGSNSPTPPTGVSTQDSANELSVAVGKTVLVDLARPISRISIGLGEIAETHAISPTEIMVNGKAPGETSLIIWTPRRPPVLQRHGARQLLRFQRQHEAIRRELRLELPGQRSSSPPRTAPSSSAEPSGTSQVPSARSRSPRPAEK